MTYDYQTEGTCSQIIRFDLEDGRVSNIRFFGGCDGNLKAISALSMRSQASCPALSAVPAPLPAATSWPGQSGWQQRKKQKDSNPAKDED